MVLLLSLCDRNGLDPDISESRSFVNYNFGKIVVFFSFNKTNHQTRRRKLKNHESVCRPADSFVFHHTHANPIGRVYDHVRGCYHDLCLCRCHYHAFAALPSYYARGGLGLHNILNHGYRGLAADHADP